MEYIFYNPDLVRGVFSDLKRTSTYNEVRRLLDAEQERYKFNGNFHNTRQHLKSLLESLDNLEKLLEPCIEKTA